VLLGALLAARDVSTVRVGVLLGALVAGTAGASLVVGAVADRVGRRRCYLLLFVGLACAGLVVAVGGSVGDWVAGSAGGEVMTWLLLLVALTGLLSTDVVDNGPATTLEQSMLANEHAGAAGRSGARVYGVYNAVALLCGAAGAKTRKKGRAEPRPARMNRAAIRPSTSVEYSRAERP